MSDHVTEPDAVSSLPEDELVEIVVCPCCKPPSFSVAKSTVLKSWYLKTVLEEGTDGKITLTGFDIDSLKCCLHFLSTGTLPLQQATDRDEADKLLTKLARAYRMSDEMHDKTFSDAIMDLIYTTCTTDLPAHDGDYEEEPHISIDAIAEVWDPDGHPSMLLRKFIMDDWLRRGYCVYEDAEDPEDAGVQFLLDLVHKCVHTPIKDRHFTLGPRDEYKHGPEGASGLKRKRSDSSATPSGVDSCSNADSASDPGSGRQDVAV